MVFAGRHMRMYGFTADEIRACLPALVEAGALVVVIPGPDPLDTEYGLISDACDDDA